MPHKAMAVITNNLASQPGSNKIIFVLHKALIQLGDFRVGDNRKPAGFKAGWRHRKAVAPGNHSYIFKLYRGAEIRIGSGGIAKAGSQC